jgi:hypothetical protein
MWAQIVNAILGLWLMASPELLGFDNPVADNDHIVGPLISSFAIIAIWEATRVVRLYNVPLAIWLLIGPWLLGYEETGASLNDMLVGLFVLILSFVKGKISQRFGGGWSAIWRSDTLHAREAKQRKHEAS